MNEAEEIFIDSIESIVHCAALEIDLINAYCEKNLLSSLQIETIEVSTGSLKEKLLHIESIIDKFKSGEYV